MRQHVGHTTVNLSFDRTLTYRIPHLALEPFWDGKTSGSYWSSNESRITNALGYTYPELKNNPSPFRLMALMEKLYGQRSVNALIKAAAAIRADSSEAKTLHAAAAPLAKAKIADILPHVHLPEGELAKTARGVLGGKLFVHQGLVRDICSTILYSRMYS